MRSKAVPACVLLSMALAVSLANLCLAGPAVTSHAEMMTLLATLEAVDSAVGQGRMHVSSIGKSVQGREIPLVVLADPKVSLAETRRMFIMCRQHGDEPASTEAMLKLIQDLVFSESTDDADMLSKVSFFIVPMVNPDGVGRNQRRNANGVDLNRDWLSLSQPEIKAVRAATDRVQPEVIIDQHELSPTNRGHDYLQCAGPVLGTSSEVARESLHIQNLIAGMLQTHDMDVIRYQIDNEKGTQLAHRYFPAYRDTKTFLFETRQAGARSDYLDYRMRLHIVGTMTIAKYLAGREDYLLQRIAEWKQDRQRLLASRSKRRTR